MRAVKGMMLIALGALSTTAALAADEQDGWRWYYNAGIPVTFLETSNLVATAAAKNLVVADEASDTVIGGQASLGAMFTRNFGLEVRYSASGTSRDELTITNLIRPKVEGNAKTSIDGITVYGVASWPLNDSIELQGRLGYSFQDLELEAGLPCLTSELEAQVPCQSFNLRTLDLGDDDDGIAAAAGVRMGMSENWAILAEIEYLAIDFSGALDEPYRGSLSIEYVF
jgi:opacity protein-like surface antigen